MTFFFRKHKVCIPWNSTVLSWVVLMLASVQPCFSQQNWVGMQTGPMFYHGDLTEGLAISPGKFSGGLYLGRKINRFVSLSTGYTRGQIEGSDQWAFSLERIMRNLSFTSDIHELDLTLQVDPGHWLYPSFQKYKVSLQWSLGLSVFWFRPKAYYQNQWMDLHALGTEGQLLGGYENNRYSLQQMAVPLGTSLQYRWNTHFTSGVQFSYRLLFTDYLDDVSRIYIDEQEFFDAELPISAYLNNRMGENSDRRIQVETGQPRGDDKKRDGFYSLSFFTQYHFGK